MATAVNFQVLIDQYHELVHQSPNDIGILTNLAWCYERTGQYKEAIQQFQRALELNKHDFNVLYGLGLSFMGDRQYNDAANAFKKALNFASSESNDRSQVTIIAKQVETLLHRLGH
jgi:tetratricopeptide (TPR) repeat protein